MNGAARRLGLSVLLLLATAGACKKKEAAPAGAGSGSAGGSVPVEIVPAAERDRGQLACRDYAAKVCGCADGAKHDLARQDQCKMARALPDALALNLEIGAHPDTPRTTMAQLQRTVRNITAQCISQLATLDAAGCPIPGVSGAAGSSIAGVPVPAKVLGSGSNGSAAAGSGSGSGSGEAAAP